MNSVPKDPPDEPFDDANRHASASDARHGDVVGPQGRWSQFLLRHRWLGFVLPFVVYMLVGQLERPNAEPQPPLAAEDADEDPFADDDQDTATDKEFAAASTSSQASRYPIAYAVRICVTIGAMLLVLPVYRQFQVRVSWLALLVGVVGAPLWIALAHATRLIAIGISEEVYSWMRGSRVAYNPLNELGYSPTLLVAFLAARFLGLALIVPIIEEFFLRGFLARFVADSDWWKVPIGAASASSLATIVVYAALTHPGEIIAAVTWFLLVTWLVAHTRNIWDAVVAHAVTNLLLGIWVLSSGEFWLW
jgi:CAAX prenyl protease-like protein